MPTQNETTAGEAEAYAAVDDVCRRLRDRGDDLSIEAASHIEGSHQAFADLVDERIEQKDKFANLQRNFDSISSLWGRVPHDVRMEVVHGKKEREGVTDQSQTTEGIPDGWVRVVVLISPNGQEVVAIGGDYQPPHDKPCPDFPQNWSRLQANLAALRRIGDLQDPYAKPAGEGPHPR